MEKLISELGTFLGGLLIGLILSLINYFKKIFAEKQKKKKSSVRYQFKEFSEIHEKLTEIRTVSEANRASIYQFHNGEYYTSNNSVLKASITYESCDETAKSFINDSQGLQASIFYIALKRIIEENEYFVILNGSEVEDSSLKKLLLYRGIDVSIISPIWGSDKEQGKDKEIIGILKLDYNYDFIPKEKLRSEILSYANIISYIFSKNQ